jgi:hypothetical protein
MYEALHGSGARAKELDGGGLEQRPMAPARTPRSSVESMRSSERWCRGGFVAGRGCAPVRSS